MIVKLDDVCERASSNIKQSDVIGKSGDYPIYGAAGYIGNVDFYHQEKPYIAVVKDGAGIGRTMLLPAKSSVIGTMQYLLPKPNISAEYLRYVVQHMHLEKYYSGATIPHIYFRDYKEEQFNLSSPEDQAQIVGSLKKVEGIIEKRQRELSSLDDLIKARFVEMFGGVKYLMVMSDICSIITDGTHQPPKFKEDGIPFIFVSNITGDKLTYDAEKFIDQDTYDELVKRTPIEIGDVLLSTVGSYGHPAVVKSDKRFLFQRHIAYLKPRREIVDSDYLHGAILSPGVQQQIEESVKGIAQKTLNLSEIKKIRIPIPNMDEQKEFASFVAQVDKSKSRKKSNYKTNNRLAS